MISRRLAAYSSMTRRASSNRVGLGTGRFSGSGSFMPEDLTRTAAAIDLDQLGPQRVLVV